MLIYTLRVERLQKETADTLTIFFKQPALKKVRYKAGQYLTLIFRINGRRYIRPYSFSSAPCIDSTLNVTIKRVQGGVVSNHILDKISDSVKNKHIILWGSGSGITPLMSIAKFALNSAEYEHVTLVYGNRSFETTIFSEQIKELQQLNKERFSVWRFYTKAIIKEDNPYIIQGRIEPGKVLKVIQNEVDIKNTTHYICGPIGLKDSVKTELVKLNVPYENIFAEDFEVTRDPKEFEDIFTRNVAITLDGQSTAFEVAKGKSILEAGLDAMLELPYSCQTGSCLLCKATLTGGKIKTIGIAELPAELHDNECLLCCSFPLTDNVEVLINN